MGDRASGLGEPGECGVTAPDGRRLDPCHGAVKLIREGRPRPADQDGLAIQHVGTQGPLTELGVGPDVVLLLGPGVVLEDDGGSGHKSFNSASMAAWSSASCRCRSCSARSWARRRYSTVRSGGLGGIAGRAGGSSWKPRVV